MAPTDAVGMEAQGSTGAKVAQTFTGLVPALLGQSRRQICCRRDESISVNRADLEHDGREVWGGEEQGTCLT